MNATHEVERFRRGCGATEHSKPYRYSADTPSAGVSRGRLGDRSHVQDRPRSNQQMSIGNQQLSISESKQCNAQQNYGVHQRPPSPRSEDHGQHSTSSRESRPPASSSSARRIASGGLLRRADSVIAHRPPSLVNNTNASRTPCERTTRSKTRSLSPSTTRRRGEIIEQQLQMQRKSLKRSLSRSRTRSLSPKTRCRLGTAVCAQNNANENRGPSRLKGEVAAAVAIRGRRPYMEDYHMLLEHEQHGYHFAGVYDGHGGQQAAEFAAAHLHKSINQRIGKGNQHGSEFLARSIRDSFLEIDNRFLNRAKERRWKCGTTALVSIIHRGEGDSPPKLTMAHVGDSRAVLCRGGSAVRLTNDHKPNDPKEMQRVVDAGGEVSLMDCWRVHLSSKSVALSCARALGDLPLKDPTPVLSADPDVSTFRLSSQDKFVILASDGVWDVMDDQDAVEVVGKVLNSAGGDALHLRSQAAADRLVCTAKEMSSDDNITAVVVYLDWS